MRASLPPRGELPPHGTIDIWVVPLSSSTEESAELDNVLSSDERRRGTHFRFVRDAARFRQCRAALRIGLSRYLDQPASELVFTTGVFGKPRLAGESRLRFNLAHSEDLAVMAFTTIGEVGIDLEAVTQTEIPIESIATAFFTPEEAALVRQQRTMDAQARTFFRLWTRKEAVLKAAGYGLSSPLDSIDVTSGNLTSVRTGLDAGIDSRWRVEDIELGLDFIGAVAGPAHDWQIRQWPRSNQMVWKETLWGKNPMTTEEQPGQGCCHSW
jgi:4'-phosphopantetheinyl transferase